jgi:hypothetical protein
MSLTKFIDENGKPLRADYFPVRLEKNVPTSGGFATNTRRANSSPPNARPKTASQSTRLSPQKHPAYLIVDYNFDPRKKPPAQLSPIQSEFPPLSPSQYEVRRTAVSTNISKRSLAGTKVNPKNAPQPLYSSFLMKQQLPPEETATGSMYKRNDAETQTVVTIERLELAGVKEYQKWTNEVVEPFIKDLRKQLKNCRPVNLEDYIIAYCDAKKNGLPVPDTTLDVAAASPTDKVLSPSSRNKKLNKNSNSNNNDSDNLQTAVENQGERERDVSSPLMIITDGMHQSSGPYEEQQQPEENDTNEN